MKTNTKMVRKPMPPCQGERSGCKVGWRYYTNEAVAREAGRIASHNADIDAAQGYDFGYQSPGSVRKMTAGEFKGMFEVCVS